MIFPTSPVVLILGALSASALFRSWQSIPKLQKYEDDAKRAAEWSTTAEKRLWDTRYTVGAGFVASLLSVATALAYLFFVGRGFGVYAIGWPLVLAGGHAQTARYMTGFWDGKAKIPLMDQYNSAIDDSKEVIKLLDPIAAGWAGVAVLKLVGF